MFRLLVIFRPILTGSYIGFFYMFRLLVIFRPILISLVTILCNKTAVLTYTIWHYITCIRLTLMFNFL